MNEFFSVIIPVFNTSETLTKLVEGINNIFRDEIRAQNEIILVNDASTNPKTEKTLMEINRIYNNVKVIMLTKNSGQYAAIICGMHYSKGDYVITMDDDLQHLPNIIKGLVKCREHDAVFAKFKQKKHTINKRLFSHIRTILNPKTTRTSKVCISGFALYQKHIVDSLLQIVSPFSIVGSHVCKLTDDVVNIDVDHAERIEGKSGYSYRKNFQLFNNLLFNHSTVLLKLIFSSGLLTFLLGLIILFILFGNYFWGDHQTGFFETIVVLVLFFSSLILTAIGIATEYIRRVLATVERRPAYVVKEILEKKEE